MCTVAGANPIPTCTRACHILMWRYRCINFCVWVWCEYQHSVRHRVTFFVGQQWHVSSAERQLISTSDLLECFPHILSKSQSKCDGTRAETRFRLSAKRTSPFKSAGASVQSTTGSRGVRISGSNARYTMFRGSVKGTGYPLHSPVSPSLPLRYPTVWHHISTAVYHYPANCYLFPARDILNVRSDAVHFTCSHLRSYGTYSDDVLRLRSFSKSCSQTPNFIFVPINIIRNLHTFKAELHRYSAKTTQTIFTKQRRSSRNF